jgi:hypothetical protein
LTWLGTLLAEAGSSRIHPKPDGVGALSSQATLHPVVACVQSDRSLVALVDLESATFCGVRVDAPLEDRAARRIDEANGCRPRLGTDDDLVGTSPDPAHVEEAGALRPHRASGDDLERLYLRVRRSIAQGASAEQHQGARPREAVVIANLHDASLNGLVLRPYER